ncbi:MAG: CHAT domain-containing protein, partial [Bacteroidota bacterium]
MVRTVLLCLLLWASQCTAADQDAAERVIATKIKIAESFLSKPRYDSALCYFRQAFELGRKRGWSRDVSYAAMRFAECEGILDRPVQALDILQLGDSLNRRYGINDPDLFAGYEDQLGKQYEQLGNIQTAEVHYRKSLEARRKSYGEEDVRTAYSYSEIAGVFSFRIEIDSAWYYANLAKSICSRHPDQWGLIRYGEVLLRYAYELKIYQRRFVQPLYKHYPDAVRAYQDVIRYTKGIYADPSVEEGMALQGMANTYTDIAINGAPNEEIVGKQAFHKALQLYKEALTVKQTIFGERSLQVATTLFTMALLHHYGPFHDRQLTALRFYQRSIEAVSRNYHPVGPLDLPIDIETDYLVFLNHLLSNRSGLLLDLFRKTNDEKYLRLLHDNNRLRLKNWDGIIANFHPRETARIISIWDQAPYEEAIESAIKLFMLSGDRSLLTEIYSIVEKGRNIEFTRQLIRSGQLSDLRHPLQKEKVWTRPVVPLKSFQARCLDDSTAFIELVDLSKSYQSEGIALLITKDTLSFIRLPDAYRMDSVIRKMRDAMTAGSPRSFSSVSCQLYSELLEPILKSIHGPKTRLILSPGGVYAGVPYDALVVDRKAIQENDFRKLPYLVQHMTVSLALGATVLYQQDTARSSGNREFMGFVPDVDRLPTLSFAKRLPEDLSVSLPERLFTGRDATVAAFRAAAGKAAILHIASHA